jgi:hypothetical protein
MSVGAVFATNIHSAIQERGGLSKDLQSLQKSLAEGNVSAAQQAFIQYKKELPSVGVKKNGVEESTRNNIQNTLKADMQGLQNALAAGDIPGAQDAFLKLKQDLRKAEPKEEINIETSKESTPKVNLQIHSSSAGQTRTGVDSRGANLDLYG